MGTIMTMRTQYTQRYYTNGYPSPTLYDKNLLQLMLAGLDGPIGIAYIVAKAVCPENESVVMAELVSLGLLNTGIATLLMTTVGAR